MKRFLAIALACFMIVGCFSLYSCEDNAEEAPAQPETGEVVPSVEDEKEEIPFNGLEGGRNDYMKQVP